MPYIGKKRPRTSDIGMTKHFPEFITKVKEASEIHKDLKNTANNPNNWHLDSFGLPYLVDPKTKQTIGGTPCPQGILYVLKKKEKGQQEPMTFIDLVMGRWFDPARKKKATGIKNSGNGRNGPVLVLNKLSKNKRRKLRKYGKPHSET